MKNLKKGIVVTTTISRESWQGFDSFRIFNANISLRLIPELGCKIAEITDVVNGYEWLWTDASRPYRRRSFGDRYDQHDISGFDECFPNIAAGHHPQIQDGLLPDHGELWCQPWTVRVEDDVLVTEVSSRLFEYSFCRRISLSGRTIFLDYQVHNESLIPLEAFWSAHPLFHAHEGMHIEITGNPEMTKEFGFSGRMGEDGLDGYGGHLNRYKWPVTLGADGKKYDLSQISFRHPLTDKVVLRSPTDGLVKLVNPKIGRQLHILFDPVELPYVGICFNLAAWPTEGETGRWVAIEPSNGGTDRLDEVLALSPLINIKPKAKRRWKLSFSIQ